MQTEIPYWYQPNITHLPSCNEIELNHSDFTVTKEGTISLIINTVSNISTLHLNEIQR